ncbi:MAG: winged helix-turn-helix transcriptional regulator [Candidatus Marinimicrobia bacterium]|nr:winged helix-turn-helix transcriptional regulator [Candidatus Neomarinimicrobiota bacterium]
MNIPELLTDLTIHYNALLRQYASQLSLTAPQAFHLLAISTDGISMSNLAHKLGLDNSTLTRNIQKLDKLELVLRKKDSYDKRVLKVHLTEKGRTIVTQLESFLVDLNYSMLKHIDLDDQENIPEMLEKLVWAMDCIREK